MNDWRRLRRLGAPVCLLLLAAALCLPAAAEEGRAEREERYNGLIESLNASSERRARAVDAIYAELKGPNAREMQELLRLSLRRTNSLILLGAVEAMAMYGDPRDVDALEELVATTSSLEVKVLAIRLLPSFCLSAERARFNYIRYAAGYSENAPPLVLAPLRRPPLTRRGRLDPALDRLRLRIAADLARQFDPVAAALAYVDSPGVQNAARAAVANYVGPALGNDPARWRDIWADQGRSIPYLSPPDLEEICLAVLQSLTDMGAEGTPEIIAALAKLPGDMDSVLAHAMFDAMGAMCRAAYAERGELAAITFDPADAREGEAWRNRRAAAAVDLAVFAAGRAESAMTGPGSDTSGFGAAASCLGAALSRPAGFPDPDGRLEEARSAGMLFLERTLLMPDLAWERRAAVARAMGDVGLASGIAAITGILRSPYASPEFGTGGLRLAEAAVEGLAAMATGGHEARDGARAALLGLLADDREFPPSRAGGMPMTVGHLALWRLQRLARSNEVSMDPGFWRTRLGW